MRWITAFFWVLGLASVAGSCCRQLVGSEFALYFATALPGSATCATFSSRRCTTNRCRHVAFRKHRLVLFRLFHGGPLKASGCQYLLGQLDCFPVGVVGRPICVVQDLFVTLQSFHSGLYSSGCWVTLVAGLLTPLLVWLVSDLPLTVTFYGAKFLSRDITMFLGSGYGLVRLGFSLPHPAPLVLGFVIRSSAELCLLFWINFVCAYFFG